MPVSLYEPVDTQGPSSGVIIPPPRTRFTRHTKLDCLPEASLPGIIRQHLWSLGRTKGHFYQSINSAHPQFVPPFTFPPIRLRQVAPLPITSQTAILKDLSLLKHPFVNPTDHIQFVSLAPPHVHEQV